MLNEMRYVYAVYQEKSFTQAAKKMFISQPALSKMVKLAETEVGVPLFDRSTVPLTLTREGKVYIDYARKILHLEQDIRTYFSDIHSLKSGSIAVGGSSFFCSFVLPRLFGIFSALYPNIALSMIEGNVSTLRAGLEDESIDLIIETSLRENDPGINIFLPQTENIILAVPESFAINRKLTQYRIEARHLLDNTYTETVMPVPFESFRDIPFILLTDGNDLLPRALSICREAGFSPKIVMQVEQILTATNLCASGLGAAFTRPAVQQYHPIQGKICFYRLGSPLAKRKIVFASKKSRHISRAMESFLKIAEAEMEQKSHEGNFCVE